MNSRISLRPSLTFWVVVSTTMPSETGVVQAVSSLGPKAIFGEPSASFTTSPVARSTTGRPTSTRHMRHMPTGSILG